MAPEEVDSLVSRYLAPAAHLAEQELEPDDREQHRCGADKRRADGHGALLHPERTKVVCAAGTLYLAQVVPEGPDCVGDSPELLVKLV